MTADLVRLLAVRAKAEELGTAFEAASSVTASPQLRVTLSDPETGELLADVLLPCVTRQTDGPDWRSSESQELAVARKCLECGESRVQRLRRGRCESCYRRQLGLLKRDDSVHASTAVHPGVRALQRIEITEEGCWRFLGSLSRGYGIIYDSVFGRRSFAHRVVWDLLMGDVPQGFYLDHLCHGRDVGCAGGRSCRHRRCLNPEHMEPVTSVVNTMRGLSPAAENARKTHCVNGHELTPDNIYWGTPKKPHLPRTRRCRICLAKYRADFRARRRAASS